MAQEVLQIRLVQNFSHRNLVMLSLLEGHSMPTAGDGWHVLQHLAAA